MVFRTEGREHRENERWKREEGGGEVILVGCKKAMVWIVKPSVFLFCKKLFLWIFSIFAIFLPWIFSIFAIFLPWIFSFFSKLFVWKNSFLYFCGAKQKIT